MTIQEVLKAAQEIYPEAKPHELKVSVDRYWYGDGEMRSTYYIFVPDCAGASKRIYSSDRSWEHVLAQAKADNEDVWPEVEEEIEA